MQIRKIAGLYLATLCLLCGYSGAFAEILNSELGSYILISTVERTYTRALVNEKMLEMTGVLENDGSDKNFSLKGIEYKLTGEIRVNVGE